MSDFQRSDVAVRLRARNLRAGRRIILADVDLCLPAGGVHALIGPNGAGKTTLLKAIAGDAVPGVETLEWFGANAQAMTAQQQAVQRAAVFNEPIPQFGWTSLEFVGFGVLSEFGRSRVGDEAARALEFCGARHLAQRSVDVLSAGELARVRLAQAIATGSRLLILDEPDAALDVSAREELQALLASLSATVVLVSHDVSSIGDFADSVHRVEGGAVSKVAG